ncbi:cytochrome c biogenesis protein DipZ [Ideonella sp. BN130291]|uniref:cytochrome c biogenesis protein DipZ n=1 Tax=Ideonella sp. BN130291 TaxID=3112940 RepID=UPI002E271A31|nr:cytochrome c biogenesis protein CcdA [Ideonella sp. BN130291]
MLQLLLAGGAGMATVASPCILPMLPLLLGGTVGHGGRARPLFIVLGFVLSFSAAGLAFGASARAAGLSQDTVRQLAILALLLFGTLLAWPTLLDRVMAPFGRVADLAARFGRRSGSGRAGGFLLGLSLGALWTPCAGPVLASILALVAGEQDTTRAAVLLLAYALGAGVPMLLIAYGGQWAGNSVRRLTRHATRLRQGFGVLVIGTALAMQTGADVSAAAWLADLASTPAEASAPRAAAAPTVAPEFEGIAAWFNSAPLTVAGLRGKVVLVDFWTFGCVNCVRTLPALKEWHERYGEQGLVVVGVHTPEFGFERSAANLQAAINRHGIRYPVAQDNGYRTWNAWANRYWPAQYLIDRQGRIVLRHFGEGDEAAIEQAIARELARP